jgi:hypothetical protein
VDIKRIGARKVWDVLSGDTTRVGVEKLVVGRGPRVGRVADNPGLEDKIPLGFGKKGGHLGVFYHALG